MLQVREESARHEKVIPNELEMLELSPTKLMLRPRLALEDAWAFGNMFSHNLQSAVKSFSTSAALLPQTNKQLLMETKCVAKVEKFIQIVGREWQRKK